MQNRSPAFDLVVHWFATRAKIAAAGDAVPHTTERTPDGARIDLPTHYLVARRVRP